MKIESSSILLASRHSAIEKHTIEESLRMWSGDRRPDFEGRRTPAQIPAPDLVSLSPEGKAAAQADSSRQTAAIDPEKELENDPRYLLIKLMVEALTGTRIKLLKMEDIQPASSAPGIRDPNKAAAPEQPKRAGYGIEYDRREIHYEAERTAFSAKGTVKTADGREIRLNLELFMSREHLEQTSVSLRLGDAKMKDPLVVNFGGTAAQLTNAKFSFDLDSDGKDDQISFVGAGSGFLALDRNGDGKINDGGELFGPATGSGFSELAAYDQDNNGWIDENDAVYAQLRVWTKDAEGNDALSTLAEKKIGAIHLGNVGTPFALKNGQNRLDGQIQSSGIYLNEDGGVGTVQQVDLAV